MTLDERLRAALARRADEARVPADLYARVLDRRRRRRRTILLAPVAATAAVVALAVAVAAGTGGGETPPPAAGPTGPASPPPLAAVLTTDGPFLFDSEAGRLGAQYGPRADTLSVASGHDGETYAYGEPDGAVAGACSGTVVRVRIENGSANEQERIIAEGRVSAIAYSPDGRRLAYVVLRKGAGTAGCDRAEVHVRDVATGAERVWNDGIPPTSTVMGGTFATNLSWSGDGTRLAYSAGVCCAGGGEVYVMGAEAPSGHSFLEDRVGPRSGPCQYLAPAYRGDTLTAVRSCPQADAPAANTLVTLDERSGEVGDVLARLSVGADEDVTRVAWAPGGGRALIVTAKPDQPGRLLLWGAGDAAHPLSLPGVRDVSW